MLKFVFVFFRKRFCLWTKHCLSCCFCCHRKQLSHCSSTEILLIEFFCFCFAALSWTTCVRLMYACVYVWSEHSRFLQRVSGCFLQQFTSCLLLYDLKANVFYENSLNSITTNPVLYEKVIQSGKWLIGTDWIFLKDSSDLQWLQTMSKFHIISSPK